MPKKKRKKGNSSGSDCTGQINKVKQLKTVDFNSSTVVSEIVNQTNSVLYDSCEELDNSILSDSMIRPKPDSDSKKEKENSNMASEGKSDLACDMSGKLDTLISVVIELKNSQEGMKRMFKSKIDKLRTDGKCR